MSGTVRREHLIQQRGDVHALGGRHRVEHLVVLDRRGT